MLYKAFISYSHAADGKLAPAVQHALHRIAKPWYKLRTMRIFRDKTNLATSPGLWTSIESALREAEFFVYMASPTAAMSPWVQKEVEWWLKNRSWQSFLILLTDGDIAWDDEKHDLNWTVTTALPRQLANVFFEEPLYTDLRWAKTLEQLSSRHSQFRFAILDLAATLLNRSKDELDGDDVRQYRRTRQIAWFGVTALGALFIAASLAAYFAFQQSMLSTSRALGARSEAVLSTNPELAVLLAQEALRFKVDEQAEYALRQAFVRNPRRMIHHASPGRTVVAKFVGLDFVIAAESGKRAVVWRATTGQRIDELSYEVSDQLVLSNSADYSLVAVPIDEVSFALYNGKTWKKVATLPGSGARFSDDGRVLTAVEGNKILQWTVPSLQERKVATSLLAGYIVRDISKDGGLLFIAKDQEVSHGFVVQAESGQKLARLPERTLREGTGFSPDGRFLVTETLDGSVGFELWNTQTGRQVRVLDKPLIGDIGWTTHVTFSPDGKMFVTGNRSGDIHVWNVETGEWLGSYSIHLNDIRKIEFSPDGKTMLSAAVDDTACLWDTASMRCLVRLGGNGDGMWDIGFAADSKHFLTTHVDGTVRLWHRETWYPSLIFPAYTAIVSDEGRLVLGATEKGSVQLWGAETGKLETTLEQPLGTIERMAMNLPSSLIAIAPTEGVVRLWSTKTGKRTLLQLTEESVRTSALAFNAAGTLLVTGSKDGKVRLWNMRDGALFSTWTVSQNKISDLVIHPDGEKIVVAAWEGRAQVRDIKSGAVLLEAKLDEEGAVAQGLALSSDGNLILVSGDKFPQVWDLSARNRIQTLAGHADDVFSVAFSKDSRLLLTGSGFMHARGEPPEDGNAVHVWDAKSGRQLMSYRSAGYAIQTVSFANDGTWVFAGSGDGMVRRYTCEVCLPLPKLNDLISSRTGRILSDEERAHYVPVSPLLGWIVDRLPSRYNAEKRQAH